MKLVWPRIDRSQVVRELAQRLTMECSDLNAGTGYMFLFFGWGCLVWQPLALQYGKRPVYLFSILATMGIMVWAPYTTTNGQWIANKILQGFFGAPIESLCEISVTDIYFTHERGSYMALYAFMLAGSNYFAPIIAGFINDGQGWQWVLYWCAIFCGIGFVFLFFFMEETNYHRSTLTATEPAALKDEAVTAVQSSPTSTEKGSKEVLPSPNTEPIVSEESGYTSAPAKKKTYAAKLAIFQTSALHQPNRLIGMMTRPLIFLTFPSIAYAGFSYGSNLIWFNVLNGTASLILGSPPYSFPSSMVGLSYLSPLIGVGVAAYFTGRFGDWFVVRMARRNKGIMEPEHRLWLFSLSLGLIPFGLLLWGVGAAHHVQWFGLIFAMGVIAATNTVGIQVSVSYCVDSYRDLSGEAMITVILVRNTMSFAIGYGITPWVTNMGYQNAFIVAAFAGLAQVLTFLVFVKWGKRWREGTTRRYWKYVEEMAKAGLTH